MPEYQLLALTNPVLSTHAKRHRLPEAVIEDTKSLYRQYVIPRAGRLEWPALLRKLDRIDGSCRE
jgi:hypothetical protein